MDTSSFQLAQEPVDQYARGTAMKNHSDTAVAPEIGALIEKSLRRCHDVHRVELAELQPIMLKAKTDHADDSQAPSGLAQVAAGLASEIEYMAEEEMVLFPAMRVSVGPGIEHSIAVMRGDHAVTIAPTRRLTNDLVPSEHACGSRLKISVRRERCKLQA